METKSDLKTYTYLINKHDIISSVSDNWQSFVVDNSGADNCNPEHVVGWNFICGMETTHLYEIILRNVRYLNRPAMLLFRCDSPILRRFLQLSIIPLKDEAVAFRSQVVRTEERESVTLLRSDIDRSDEFLSICSMCKRIAVSNNEWEETEDAINTLRLFEKHRLPRLTHGICHSCHREAMLEVSEFRARQAQQ